MFRIHKVSSQPSRCSMLYPVVWTMHSIQLNSTSVLTSLLLCTRFCFSFLRQSSVSPHYVSHVRAWRRQTTIPTCLRTTLPWSTTSRERARWQAASVPSPRAARTETRTTTTSTTGDHGSRNLPTCTTHAELAGASENRGQCLGH